MTYVYVLQQNLEDGDKIIGVYDTPEEPELLVTSWMRFEERNATDIGWGMDRRIPDVIEVVDDLLGTVFTISKKELNKTVR